MGMCDNEEFTADDRQILEDMLYPIFEAATAENRPVSRDMIRMEIGKLWDWPQIFSVLNDLEEKDYIETLSTRGGGIFQTGEKYQQWVDEMAPIEYDDKKAAASAAAGERVELSPAEAESLVALIRMLASPEVPADSLTALRGRLEGNESPKIILKDLAAFKS